MVSFVFLGRSSSWCRATFQEAPGCIPSCQPRLEALLVRSLRRKDAEGGSLKTIVNEEAFGKPDGEGWDLLEARLNMRLTEEQRPHFRSIWELHFVCGERPRLGSSRWSCSRRSSDVLLKGWRTSRAGSATSAACARWRCGPCLTGSPSTASDSGRSNVPMDTSSSLTVVVAARFAPRKHPLRMSTRILTKGPGEEGVWRGSSGAPATARGPEASENTKSVGLHRAQELSSFLQPLSSIVSRPSLGAASGASEIPRGLAAWQDTSSSQIFLGW